MDLSGGNIGDMSISIGDTDSQLGDLILEQLNLGDLILEEEDSFDEDNLEIDTLEPIGEYYRRNISSSIPSIQRLSRSVSTSSATSSEVPTNITLLDDILPSISEENPSIIPVNFINVSKKRLLELENMEKNISTIIYTGVLEYIKSNNEEK